MKAIELPNKYATCPHCGEKLDGSTCVTKEIAIPKEGDIGVCFKCGTLLEYEEGFFVHELPEATLNGFKLLDPKLYLQLIFTQKAIQRFRAQKKPDENCNGCIHQVRVNQCELDTDDDSPCFHYDHYTPGVK